MPYPQAYYATGLGQAWLGWVACKFGLLAWAQGRDSSDWE